jgi:hypothetical protein
MSRAAGDVDLGDGMGTPIGGSYGDPYESEDPIICSCPCGCLAELDGIAFEGDRCSMCSEACPGGSC